ncbi:thioesterase II family protein [Psychrobacter aquimaris]|uniref:thioesterase II family protein n=1 Tax=Psychrobacter aquimaris TaxID=292733 RepID=UPI003FD17A47
MKLKIYCLPCAGASAAMYLPWVKHLPSSIKIIPLELAGRGKRIGESSLHNFQSQVEDIYLNYFEKELLVDIPYVIFGHSMGAMLGYQLIQKLREKKLSLPKALFVSASPAPMCRDTSGFDNLDDASLIEDLRQYNGTPEAVFEHTELLEMLLRNLRSDYQVCASNLYLVGMPTTIPIPIHAFAGAEDNIVIENIVSWSKYTTDEFTVDVFKGGHFYLKHEESETVMLNRISQLLMNYIKL